MNKPQLSICIATYNRAEFLRHTLDSIIPQVTDGVEVIVADGNSSDNTPQLMSNYTKKYRFIKYIRLPEKGGVDHDYAKAVEYAAGEYCWLFTDDDLLVPNAIRCVQNELETGHSLIIVNAEVKNKDLGKTLSPSMLKIYSNEIYTPAQFDLLFKRVIPYISFIGCVIIKREIWISRELKKYFGTEFIHVGVIFQEKMPSSALILKTPLVTIRLGNAQWSPRSFSIWMNKWPKLLDSFTSISRNVVAEVNDSRFIGRLKKLMIHRAKSEYTLTEYKKYYISPKFSPLWLLAAFITSILPSTLVKSGLMLFFRLTKNREAIEWWHNF